VKCPKCEAESSLKVTHTYGSDYSFTQRAVCGSCGAVVVRHATVVAVDPPHGEGAAAIAERMKRTGPGLPPDPDLS